MNSQSAPNVTFAHKRDTPCRVAAARRAQRAARVGLGLYSRGP